MTQVDGAGRIGIHGHLTITTVDHEWFEAHRGDTALMLDLPDGVIEDRRDGDNIMCTAGLSTIAQALMWSGIQDQAANLGVTTPSYLTPLWGAVGSGTGTVAASDTALFTELARQTVGAGAAVPATSTVNAQTTWLFYFSPPSTQWVVTEAGVFANGSSSSGSVLSAGVLLDHWSFSSSITVPTTNTLILQASFVIAP